MKVNMPQSALAVSSSLLTADEVRPITSMLSSSVLCLHYNTNETLCPNLDLSQILLMKWLEMTTI